MLLCVCAYVHNLKYRYVHINMCTLCIYYCLYMRVEVCFYTYVYKVVMGIFLILGAWDNMISKPYMHHSWWKSIEREFGE